jgi:hypothetical protein
MKTLLAALLCLAPALVFAADKEPAKAGAAVSDYLSDAEMLDGCADELPKQLECKAEFCNAMVDIRRKYQPKFAGVDRNEMVKGCLGEIAVDGTGDQKTRRARCESWSKGRPAMKISRTDAAEQSACWTKSSCGEKIGCWGPLTDKKMSAMAKPAK